MLTAGYISAVFGSVMPGPGAIYVSQTLNFRAPVEVGDHVVARVKVTELTPRAARALRVHLRGRGQARPGGRGRAVGAGATGRRCRLIPGHGARYQVPPLASLAKGGQL